MKVGIMADSHDHLPRVRQAIQSFVAAGVEHVFHAGDVCAPFVFLEFKNANLPFHAVFGNNDGEWIFLIKLARGLGEIRKGPLAVELGGKRFALMHEPAFLDALADSGHLDVIIYGHTHEVEERRRGQALILNPGENCGYLKNKATAMILDLETMAVTVVEQE